MDRGITVPRLTDSFVTREGLATERSVGSRNMDMLPRNLKPSARYWRLGWSSAHHPQHASELNVMVNCNCAEYAFLPAPRVSYVELRSIVG